MAGLFQSVLWGLALANAEAVNVSVTHQTLVGKGFPTVHISIQAPIAGFRLSLKRSDGNRVDVKGGGKPGQQRDIELVQPEGKFGYQGELVTVFPNAKEERMPLQFEAELTGPLRVEVPEQGVDLLGRKLKFSANRPVQKAELLGMCDNGREVFREEQVFSQEATLQGTLEWPAVDCTLMKITLTVTDAGGFYSGMHLFPWRIDIPHEEVNFVSGKWDIAKSEKSKLDKAAEAILEAVRKYGSFADIKLYVAGHTDTVGDAASNRSLSWRRAQAIAGYFRNQGVAIPIFFDGYGETSLRVQTADEADEIRNRRAEYVIAIEAPVLGAQAAAWKKL